MERCENLGKRRAKRRCAQGLSSEMGSAEWGLLCFSVAGVTAGKRDGDVGRLKGVLMSLEESFKVGYGYSHVLLPIIISWILDPAYCTPAYRGFPVERSTYL